MSAASSQTAPHFILPRTRSFLLSALRRRLAGLAFWSTAYRPERHYMRGGTTEGSRSLAAARHRIVHPG